MDQLYLNAGVGSGHDFALGWTFCDERELFGESANAVPGCMDENACNYDASATVDDGSCDVVEVTLEGTVAGEGSTPGSADIGVTGGSGVYTFSWTDANGTEVSTDEDVTLVSGTYNVMVTDSLGCSGSLEGIVIDNTDRVIDLLAGVGIYPNPTAGVATLMLPQGVLANIAVLDMRGRTVRVFTQVQDKLQVDGLHAGQYLVRVTSEGQMVTMRLAVLGQ